MNLESVNLFLSLTTQVTLSKSPNSSGPHLHVRKVDHEIYRGPSSSNDMSPPRRNHILSDLLTGLPVSIPFRGKFTTKTNFFLPKFSYEIQLCSDHICNRVSKATHGWATAYCPLPTAINDHSFTYLFNCSFKKHLLCISHGIPMSARTQAHALLLTHQAFLGLRDFACTFPFARNALSLFSSGTTLIHPSAKAISFLTFSGELASSLSSLNFIPSTPPTADDEDRSYSLTVGSCP